MDTLYDDGINMKAYKTWFRMNSNTRIQILTGSGLTSSADVNEVVGQGTAGGSLASQRNIDKGVDNYFSGSPDEINYGRIRMQPLSFQDDILRMAPSVGSARVGNIKLSSMMKEKQLECHPDKTSYLVLGNKAFKEKAKMEIRFDGEKWKLH